MLSVGALTGCSNQPAAGEVMTAQSAHAPQADGALESAAGVTTVAKVWAERTALAGKTMTVRGQVVKFNGGILDRNWLHIQDGTGTATEGTHDLTITTKAAAKVGDLVTATGTVTIDKDFGAGYVYKVILTDATVTAK
jgi:hypothetical protein